MKEMILVMEKTVVLKVEREMILLINHGEDDDAAKEPSCAFVKGNWAQCLPELSPMKCQKKGCDKLVHHLCQSE
jgi:hypothetical protein